MRFPPSMSARVQMQVYFLVSQQYEWRAYVEYLLRDADGIIRLLHEYGDNMLPDAQTIATVLVQTEMVGMPFQELKHFNEAMTSFSTRTKCMMTTNQLFRLYAAVYQDKRIWRLVWKLLRVCSLSSQIVQDVEHFTSTHPINASAISSIIIFGNAQGLEDERNKRASLVAGKKQMVPSSQGDCREDLITLTNLSAVMTSRFLHGGVESPVKIAAARAMMSLAERPASRSCLHADAGASSAADASAADAPAPQVQCTVQEGIHVPPLGESV